MCNSGIYWRSVNRKQHIVFAWTDALVRKDGCNCTYKFTFQREKTRTNIKLPRHFQTKSQRYCKNKYCCFAQSFRRRCKKTRPNYFWLPVCVGGEMKLEFVSEREKKFAQHAIFRPKWWNKRKRGSKWTSKKRGDKKRQDYKIYFLARNSTVRSLNGTCKVEVRKRLK